MLEFAKIVVELMLNEYNLGWMYQEGIGVHQDLNQAKIWYEKAAAQGNEQSEVILEKLKYL